MEIIKIYVNDKDEATVICKSCGRRKTTSAAPFKNVKHVKVNCPCGCSFAVSFEVRKYYRKEVSFAGHFIKPEFPREGGDMVVEDLSVMGIGFRTNQKHGLKIGDIVKVQFSLKDDHKTEIVRNVTVRRVIDRFIGAEFCDQAQCKPLSFFLLP